MEETPGQRAQREAEETIRYAHQMTELMSYLVLDMKAANILRPATKSKIAEILQNPYRVGQAGPALERLRRGLEETPVQRELKKKLPD